MDLTAKKRMRYGREVTALTGVSSHYRRELARLSLAIGHCGLLLLHLFPVLEDLARLIVLQVVDAALAHLVARLVQNYQHWDLHDAKFLLKRLLAGLIVVLDREPVHLIAKVAIEGVLVTILTDKDDLELVAVGVNLRVLLHQRRCEAAAARGPVRSKVKTHEVFALEGSCGGLCSQVFLDELGAKDILHLLSLCVQEN